MAVTAPIALFRRVDDTGAYGGTLFALLLISFVAGYVEVASGLTDRTVDEQTERRLADLELHQGGLIDRVELTDRMEDIRKEGEFNKLLARLGVIVATPAYLLTSYLLIAALFYAIVAMTGRKPEYQTLMSICVFAGVIEVIGLVLRVAMVIYYKDPTMRTSLDLLAPVGEPSALVAVDPFRTWFWILVMTGLIVTRQLSKRVAIVSVLLFVLIAAGARVGLSFSAA